MKKVFEEEDVVCDDCCMEICGEGIPSGYESGAIVNGWERTGWIHTDRRICDDNREEEAQLRRFEDGIYTEPPRAPLR